MKKVLCLIICLLLLMVVSCSEDKHTPAIYQVDSEISAELINFLNAAAFGWEVGIIVEGSVGLYEVGEVWGSYAAGVDMEIAAYSLVGDDPVEIGRTTVAEDGSWGPLTVLYGPKLLAVWDGDRLVGEWSSRRHFVSTPSFARDELNNRAAPLDSAITAIAFIQAHEWQAAADVLGALQPIHSQYGGLPAQADIFGRSQDGEIDFTVTAWAGYAVALLASATDQDALWQEAMTYAGYLKNYAPMPQDNQALVPMRLMQEILALRDPTGLDKAVEWQPDFDADYDCWQGFAAIMLDEVDSKSIVDFEYKPESEAEKWVHYFVLAELGRDPDNLTDELAALISLEKGKAVTCNEQVSIQATAWMLFALSGAN